jgi:predicted Ser/Thr protein kinase
MESRFSVEAKAFYFLAVSGKQVLRLGERRKGFRGFILLGVKASVWLADMLEDAFETQRREDFARSFCDEVRVLKVRMGRNMVGCFLEVVERGNQAPWGPWRLGLVKIRGGALSLDSASWREGLAGGC